MNPVQQMTNITNTSSGVVHLMLTVGGAGLTPQDPERLMEEIELRATQMSSLLEGILHDPHGEPRWGLNE